MSYEGYDRFLCSNGHLWELDAHVIMYDEELQKCPTCKEKEVWSEMIDETNGEGNPTKLVLDNEKTKVCKHCETVLQVIYINPHDTPCTKDEEVKKWNIVNAKVN